MNKTIKRIVALGTGAAMLGATVLGALAADLSQYPKPFVDNGKFNGLVVVGEKSMGIDSVGAADILASLQAANVVTKTISGTTETTMEGGKKIESAASHLYLGSNLSDVRATFTKEDFPVLLKQNVLVADDGTEYKYDTEITNPAWKVTFDNPDDEKFTQPLPYLAVGDNQSIKITMIFNKPVQFNTSNIMGTNIELFGKEYVISDSSSEVTSTLLTLYSTAVDQTFTAGEAAKTISIGGKDVTVEVIGVRTGGSSDQATIKINGETKQVTAGNSYTIGGQRVYVKDVMAYDQPVGGGAVRLFLGSEKLTIDKSTGEVKRVSALGKETTMGGIKYTGDSFDNLNTMKFEIDPYNFDNFNNSVKYITDEFVEPLFGAFKYAFVGPNPAYDSTAREKIKIQQDGTAVRISFTDRDGNSVSVSPIKYNSSSENFEYMIGSKPLHVNSSDSIGVDEYFILDVEGYSYIMQLKKIDTTNNQVTLKNYVTGEELVRPIITGTNSTPDTVTYSFHGVPVTFDVTTTSSNIKLDSGSYIVPGFYTAQGALIVISNGSIAAVGVMEDAGNWIAQPTDEPSRVLLTTTWSYSDSKAQLSTSEPASRIGDTDDYVGVTAFGTYYTYNTEKDVFEIKYYKNPTVYEVFLAPTGATATTAGGENTYQEVVPIKVGAAVLDSQISDIWAQNLIVVGGPCANKVAAQLMGNPTVCNAGFEPGKAFIRLYEQNGKVAILVAGYEGEDTLRASRVLADYKKYGLSGTSVEVTGTSLTDITVSKPQ